MKSHRISVLGAGSWGTALAILLAENGNETCLWGHDVTHIAKLKKRTVMMIISLVYNFPKL
jgi:glycerol-3-phosphate dehydrogenase (NAD(P)+)